MRQFRNPLMSRRLAGLLSLVMLVQGVLPLAAHTTLARDANGEVVKVCTLHGLQTRFVDSHGDLSPDAPTGDDETPAIKFSQLMAAALSVAVPVIIEPQRFAAVHGIASYLLIASEAAAGLQPIRAPPLS